MQMTGEQRIPASKQQVWEALNDPDVLRACIPGCQSLERNGDQLNAAVEIKIGPIGTRFKGVVQLGDLDPPNGYMLTGEGNGGIAGSAKGAAQVKLADDAGGGTLLTYTVDAQVGGRLAQLGGPIIDATAKQLARRFFAKLGEVVGGAQQPTASAGMPSPVERGMPIAAPPRPPAAATSTGLPIAWILTAVVAALAGFLIGRSGAALDSDWSGLAIGLLVVVVAAAGFEHGRRAGATTLVLDDAALRRLLGTTLS